MNRYATLPQTPSSPLDDPLASDMSGSTVLDEMDSEDSEEKPGAFLQPQRLREDVAQREIRGMLGRHQRRQSIQFLILLSVGIVACTLAFSPSHSLGGQLSVYRSCGYDALLRAIKGASVRSDGLSTRPNYTQVDYVSLDPFKWSFDLPELGLADAGGGQTVEITEACKPMHVYSQAEACELLSSFGGLYSTGDSYVRHLHTALMMILRDRNDGAVRDYASTGDCRREQAFDDGKLCRDRINMDTNVEENVCGNAAQVAYRLMYWPQAHTYEMYRDWRARLPQRNQPYSPVLITGLGLHFGFNLSVHQFHDWIEADRDFTSRQYPAPVKLFLGPHKPGRNQQPVYIPKQGPLKLAAYKEAAEKVLASYSSSPLATEGSWRYLDTWGMTDGAVSYDGSHYSYQVNMEKAQTVLNLLDVLWGEIVAAGGLAEIRPPL
ncbi:hypothetical protein JCM8202v2_004114 [Rhodotorula sphaerocarpa]